MSTLTQESRVENIVLAGEIQGATVRLNYSRENNSPVRQITVHATKQMDNSDEQMNLYIDYQLANNGVNINVHNCGLDNVPFELIGSLLSEMQAVNNKQGKGK